MLRVSAMWKSGVGPNKGTAFRAPADVYFKLHAANEPIVFTNGNGSYKNGES
jgi:hypothetical protein